MDDLISRQAAIDKFIDCLEEIFADIRERQIDDSVCRLCEYDGAYIGQSGDWCNECPGFEKDDCFKLSDRIRKKWADEIIKALPSAQPERKPGRWVEMGKNEDGTHNLCCGVCGEFKFKSKGHANSYYTKNKYKFCGGCGAKMEGVGNE